MRTVKLVRGVLHADFTLRSIREMMVFSREEQLLFVGCLTSPKQASVSQGRGLLRQFYVLPH